MFNPFLFSCRLPADGILLTVAHKQEFDAERAKLLAASTHATKLAKTMREKVAAELEGTEPPSEIRANVIQFPCEHCGASPTQPCRDSKYKITNLHKARKKGMSDMDTRVNMHQDVVAADQRAIAAHLEYSKHQYLDGVSERSVRLYTGALLQVVPVRGARHARFYVLTSTNVLGIAPDTEFSEQQVAFMMKVGCSVEIKHRNVLE